MSFEPKRRCRSCGESRYEGDFSYLPSGNQSSHCDHCRKGYIRNWKTSEHGKTVIRRHNKKAQKEKRAMVLASAAKVRARKKGVPFDLSQEERVRLQDVIDKGHCQITGLPFKMDNPSALFCWASPSFDRVKPELGYVDGNIRVILYGMNAAIGAWGEDVLKRMVQAWLR